MSTNPFENDEAAYFVLVNEENQHSIWPAFAEIPAGWKIVHGEGDRQGCLDYINNNWTDMRPKSLADAMDSASA